MRKDQFFFFLCISFILGVFVGSFFLVPWFAILLCFALWITLTLSFRSRLMFVFFIFLGVFFFGIFSVRASLDEFREVHLPLGTVSGSMRVVSDPEMKNFFEEVILSTDVCTSSFCPNKKILWHAPITLDISRGARIDFSCLLSLPKNFDDAFDYRMFLAKENIAYVCEKATVFTPLLPDHISKLYTLLFTPKKFFERALERSIPAPESGLALGLLVGGDHRLPEALSQAFVTTGLTHIVAISGYNIALIAQGFIIFGLFLGLWRKQALWFALVSIVLFVFLVGAPASAVRAGIMGSCVFLGLFSGRLSSGIHILTLASATMLLFNPLLLRFDIGFQLSFLATLSIILSAPFIRVYFPKPFFGKGLLEIFLLTLSVELFVGPIIAYQFHIFSPFALMMNMLVLPFVPYAMMTSFATALSFLILPGLHILPAGIAYLFLRMITFSVEQVGKREGASQVVTLPLSIFVLWYVLLCLLFFFLRKYIFRSYVKKTDIQ